MAFHLIHADGHALLASDTPLIRARDHAPVWDALALLATIRDAHDRQESLLAEARATASAEGRAAGLEEGRLSFATAIAELVSQADADRDRRQEEIGLLALAALRQMIGQMADGEMMGGIARRAVEVVGNHGPLLVEVSPAMAPAVQEVLTTLPNHIEVEVRDDDKLEDDHCRLTGPDGRIIADVGVQLAAFERRWTAADAG